jgi:hypothetical protein
MIQLGQNGPRGEIGVPHLTATGDDGNAKKTALTGDAKG